MAIGSNGGYWNEVIVDAGIRYGDLGWNQKVDGVEEAQLPIQSAALMHAVPNNRVTEMVHRQRINGIL